MCHLFLKLNADNSGWHSLSGLLKTFRQLPAKEGSAAYSGRCQCSFASSFESKVCFDRSSTSPKILFLSKINLLSVTASALTPEMPTMETLSPIRLEKNSTSFKQRLFDVRPDIGTSSSDLAFYAHPFALLSLALSLKLPNSSLCFNREL